MVLPSTIQSILDARRTEPSIIVYIAGIVTLVESFDAQHVRGQVGKGSITLPLPTPDHVQPGATVLVQAGHGDHVDTRFEGYIPNRSDAISIRGKVATLDLTGWMSRLNETLHEDVEFQGPVSLSSVFTAMCIRMGVPAYITANAVYRDGTTPVMLGGNMQYEDGKIKFAAGSTPGSRLQAEANLYGYVINDIPHGPTALYRMSGLPSAEPRAVFTENLHLRSATRKHDIREVVNYFDVEGITYEDEFGGKIPIRSRPESYTPDPNIPGGVRRKNESSNYLVRQDQADEARAILEIDYSEAYRPVSWSGVGLPGLMPGDCVRFESPSLGTTDNYWLTGIDARYDKSRGFTADYDGWAGAGETLPSLQERFTINIETPAVHLGDEYVAWYAHPATQGLERAWDFTLPVRVTVANVRGWHHSTNSQLVGGENTDLQVTKWEIWIKGTDRNNEDNKAETSGAMPRLPEDYALRLPYSKGLTHWGQFAITLQSLDPGEYTLVLKSGEAAAQDDFEVQQVILELFGTQEPAVIS